MNILITGSRKINDETRIFDVLSGRLRAGRINKKTDTLIHGGATGVDSMVEVWCKKNNIHSKIVRPIYLDKKEYYLHRNAEMVAMCDLCIAFWDGKSRGTKFTIDYAKERGIIAKVFYF